MAQWNQQDRIETDWVDKWMGGDEGKLWDNWMDKLCANS